MAYHVCNAKEHKAKALKLIREETMEETKTFKNTNNDSFSISFADWLSVVNASCAINLLEVFHSQCGWLGTVKLRDFVQNIDSVLLTSLADEKLWGFVKSENEISGKKDGKGHSADNYHHVSPAHIA